MPYSKYDWAAIGPAVIAEYKAGILSNTQLLERYNLKPGALWAFLKRSGVNRTHAEARAIAKRQGRLVMPKARPRPCVACLTPFEPVNQRHVVCLTCAPTKRFRTLFDKYGVTKPLWDKLLAAQGDRCALCPAKPTHVDHDHARLVVRGLLCATCNQSMRVIDEMPDWGIRARTYRERDTGIHVNAKRHKAWSTYRQKTRPYRRPPPSLVQSPVVLK